MRMLFLKHNLYPAYSIIYGYAIFEFVYPKENQIRKSRFKISQKNEVISLKEINTF